LSVININGIASGRLYKSVEFDDSKLELSLMDFLHQNDIPIASSCSGEGVCEKCIVNGDILSCQLSLKEFLEKFKEVQVSYL
jgi:ferredoxin